MIERHETRTLSEPDRKSVSTIGQHVSISAEQGGNATESHADYERRCSFDQPALDLAVQLERVFVSEPKYLRVTRAQIAITGLLMAKTAAMAATNRGLHRRAQKAEGKLNRSNRGLYIRIAQNERNMRFAAEARLAALPQSAASGGEGLTSDSATSCIE